MSLVTYLFAFEGVKSFFIFRKTLCFMASEFCKILSSSEYIRAYDKTRFSDEDFRNVASFPQDYDFVKNG